MQFEAPTCTGVRVPGPEFNSPLISVREVQTCTGRKLVRETSAAQRSARDNYFRLRVWTASDVIAQVTRHYDGLPEEIRTDIPLKQTWIAVEADE